MGGGRARLPLQPSQQRQPGLPRGSAGAPARKGGAGADARSLLAGSAAPGARLCRFVAGELRLLRRVLLGTDQERVVSIAADTRQTEQAPPPTGSSRVDTRRLNALAERVSTAGGEHERIEVDKPATGQLL